MTILAKLKAIKNKSIAKNKITPIIKMTSI